MPSTWTKVAATDQLAPGNAMKVDVNGQELALYNVDGKFYCTSNICPHQGGPLAEGMIEGTTVVCPWHAWVFDVTTGQSPVNPRAKIPCIPVKVEGKDVLVSV
jgi:nitrite reductase/ring-hydroxylating ferredoxin subunit